MAVKITGQQVCGYGTFVVIDYGGENYCTKCGKCCWDWKGNDPKGKCENLADDLVTCNKYGDQSICNGLLGNWPQPCHINDLPPDCGYVILWKKNNWVA